MTFEPLNPNVRLVEDKTEPIFENCEIAAWAPDGGQRIVFPVEDIQETGGNRIVERERPYRDGAKLDDTGSRAKRFEMTALFFNTINEPGLEVNGEPLYPNILNWLIDDGFGVHATGNLVVPTRPELRARADSYSRSETFDERDGGKVRLTFIHDNEDSVDASSLGMPTVNATAAQLAQKTTFSAQQAGAWDGSFQDLVHFAAELEGLANAPSDYAQELSDKVRMVQAANQRVLNAFSSHTIDGRGIFVDPAGNRTERQLIMLLDMAGRSRNAARGGKPGTVAVVFEHDQSLASIAAMLGLDYEDLLYDNPQLSTPGYVPKGTPINIPENAKIQRHG